MTSAAIIKSTTALYLWFTMAVNPANVLSLTDIEHYFTPDFSKNQNGKVYITGRQSLIDHMNEVRQSGCKVVFDLPLKEIIVSEDHKSVTIRHSFTITDPKGLSKRYFAIAIWYLTPDGRYSHFNEVTVSED